MSARSSIAEMTEKPRPAQLDPRVDSYAEAQKLETANFASYLEKSKQSVAADGGHDDSEDASSLFAELPLDAEHTVAARIPGAAWLIVVTELCERFAFYGASLLFVPYIISQLELSPSIASALNRGFIFFAYFTAIAGALLADIYLGKYRAILAFALMYVVGLILLAASATPTALAAGLGVPGFIIATYVFMASGTGGIKSNVSTFVADQVRAGFMPTATPGVYVDSRLTLERVFRYFYWAINIGSFFGMLIGSQVRKAAGFSYAFLAPVGVFIIGILVFIAGRRRYITKKPSGDALRKTFGCIRYALANRHCGPPVAHWLDRSKQAGRCHPGGETSGKDAIDCTWDDAFVDDLKYTLRGCKVFLFYPFYWALYGNMTDCFIIQGMDMRRPSWLNPEDFNLVNSVTVILAIPLFDEFIFPMLRRRGLRLGPITRIAIGFVIVTLGYVYATALGRILYNTGPYYDYRDGPVNKDGEYQNNLSIWWQLPPYIAISVSEIFASATGLEFAYKRAPPELKSVVMSLFMLSSCGGPLIGLALAGLSADPYIVTLLAVETAMMAVFTAIFYWLFRRLDDEET